ncbi:MAG: hypothetical protein LBE36_04765 [Flavobacteriaceae bacterium]|jgi:hypothetical protein|nr:hypothetical protein [Flavobacteriaceae bacterium]
MIDILKEYFTKKIELFKLEAAEKSSVGAGFLMFIFLAAIAISFFVLMLNIAIGLFIGKSLGNYGYGLLAMSIFYLILFILILVYRKAIIKSVADFIIKFLNE